MWVRAPQRQSYTSGRDNEDEVQNRRETGEDETSQAAGRAWRWQIRATKCKSTLKQRAKDRRKNERKTGRDARARDLVADFNGGVGGSTKFNGKGRRNVVEIALACDGVAAPHAPIQVNQMHDFMQLGASSGLVVFTPG